MIALHAKVDRADVCGIGRFQNRNRPRLHHQIPEISRLHLTIHVIHIKRCAGVIAIRVHATKMLLKSWFDLFCCLVWLGMCRILTKPSNDIINVGGGIIHAHVAHRIVHATRDTPMDRRGSKLERFSQLAIVVFLLKTAPGDQSIKGMSFLSPSWPMQSGQALA